MKQLQFNSLFIIPVFLWSSLESSFLPALSENNLLIVLNAFQSLYDPLENIFNNIMKNSTSGVPEVFKVRATLHFF